MSLPTPTPPADSAAQTGHVYPHHWLFWDGECGLCARFAHWVDRNDHAGRFRVLPYQQAPAPPMTPELRKACARAVHVVRADGEVMHSGRAVLFVLDRLGWRRAAGLLGSRPLLPFVELVYRWVARNRPIVGRVLRI